MKIIKENKKTYTIPYTEDNGKKQFLSYVCYGYNKEDIKEMENVVFETSVKYLTYERGRSSYTWELEDKKGNIFSMSANSIEGMVVDCPKEIDLDGQLWFVGKFTFAKKGSNYTLTYLP